MRVLLFLLIVCGSTWGQNDFNPYASPQVSASSESGRLPEGQTARIVEEQRESNKGSRIT
jgi:hypothetical protein